MLQSFSSAQYLVMKWLFKDNRLKQRFGSVVLSIELRGLLITGSECLSMDCSATLIQGGLGEEIGLS